MNISLIAALTANHVIGINNEIPWYLPTDLAWFKYNTLDKTVIMGRRTFESIGHPLPRRHNIVLSKQPHKDNRVTWVTSLESAIIAAYDRVNQEVVVIGGSSIYTQFMPLAKRMYLTHLDIKIDGDTYFPDYSKYTWKSKFIEFHTNNSINDYYYFEILDKC
ncbi:type 3 dihydrofolate reductase [Candidatus Profftia sp. (ex Adelges kitamiensis)]|uniref:type 3 dihydrofolate reductase n=1 Tax=Candidatus Profftia sp. (ex Adelges kitamiensis) TaxID=2864218 RepID=UPI001CE2AF0A|nr:type 3 dihydrofolate reductase [Candidatus Profftia sp. (ex Adelges kitamiensis)]